MLNRVKIDKTTFKVHSEDASTKEIKGAWFGVGDVEDSSNMFLISSHNRGCTIQIRTSGSLDMGNKGKERHMYSTVKLSNEEMKALSSFIASQNRKADEEN